MGRSGKRKSGRTPLAVRFGGSDDYAMAKNGPKTTSGTPRYGQPPDDTRERQMGPPEAIPSKQGAEELEDVGADGGGQKTTVGSPYESDKVERGTEKKQHRDHE